MNKNIPIFTTHEASKVLIKAGFSNVAVVSINNEYTLNFNYRPWDALDQMIKERCIYEAIEPLNKFQWFTFMSAMI